MERIVRSVRRPHAWRIDGAGWRCSECGAAAVNFDDSGSPEPYGLVLDGSLREVTCEELSVSKIMDG